MIEMSCQGFSNRATKSQDVLSSSSSSREYSNKQKLQQQKQQKYHDNRLYYESSSYQVANTQKQQIASQSASYQTSSILPSIKAKTYSQSQEAPSTVSPTNFQTNSNYFQTNNHLQPFLNTPNLLLASSAASALAAAAAAAVANASPSPSAGNGGSQFVLTPDARACVTATYLCVLIVNNTWLDCNLLEMLCNNNSNTRSNNDKSNNIIVNSFGGDRNVTIDSEYHKRRDYHLPDETITQLNAFESALNELIAFAGGGDEDLASGVGAGGVARNAKLVGIHKASGEASENYDNFQPEPPNINLPRPEVVLHDQGGGGVGDHGSDSSETSILATVSPSIPPNTDNELMGEILIYGQNVGKDDLVSRPQLRPSLEEQEPFRQKHHFDQILKAARISQDEDKYRLLESYFNLRKLQLKKNTALSQSSIRQQQGDNLEVPSQRNITRKPHQDLEHQATGSGQQQPPFSSTTPSSSGSLVSWVGRPFRGWSSYSFWSSGNNIQNQNSETPLTSTTGPNILGGSGSNPKEKQVQILRPIDRTEQYNDIATNQSTLKQSTPGVTQQQHQKQLQQVFSSLSNQHRGQYGGQSLERQQQQKPEKTSLLASELSGILTAASAQHGAIMVNAKNSSPANTDQAALFAIGQPPALQSQTFNDMMDGNSNGNSGETGESDDRSSAGESGSTNQRHQVTFTTQLRSPAPPISFMGIYEPFGSQSLGSPALVASTSSSANSPLRQQQQQQQQTDRDHHQQQQQQQQLHHNHHQQTQNQHHQQQHIVHQQQQQQQYQDDSECKCNELIDDPQQVAIMSMSSECRFRCSSASMPPSSSSPLSIQSTTTTSSLIDPSQLVTSFMIPTTSTSAASASTTTAATVGSGTSTTISPGGKMNPLDVTFLLYTRYHRDLVSDLVIQLTSGISTTTSSLATPPNRDNQQQQQQQQLKNIQLQQQQSTNSLLNTGEIIDLTNETTLSESRLNSSLPIKIIIHGFGSGGRRPWVLDMVYKLLDYEDVNVIVVDWEKGAMLPNYVQAAGNTRSVGHKIACLIKSINAKYGLTGNSYHLIGFSLGAHVAGFAGMEIRNSTNVSRLWINRITGLDPASPLFEGYEANDRLDPSDAQFVDVIHSNGDGVLRGGFGSLQPMGHVDFYPNGGRVQVGCNSVLLSALSDIIYGKWQSLCNHRRALNFFMDSFEFNKCRFRSFNCDSYENYLKGECFDCGLNNEKCSYMGYLANYSKGRGKMYLTTHEEAPFCG